MDHLALISFITAFILSIYPYFIYPLIVLMMKRPAVPGARPSNPDNWPMVSIVMSVHNAESLISAKLANFFELDYPHDKVEFVIVSDCSSDGTASCLNSFNDPRIKVYELHDRSGKTVSENHAIPYVQSEIVVFTDVAAMLHKNALKALVAPFADPEVGSVSSVDQLVVNKDSADVIGEAAYVRFEMLLRKKESDAGMLIGLSGSCFACRRDLYLPIPPDCARDFYTALLALEQNYTNISADDSLCFIIAQQSKQDDLRRRIRTVNNGVATLAQHLRLLNIIKYGRISFAIISHKIIRWINFIFLMLALVFSILAADDWFWISVLLVQILIYGMTIITHCFGKKIPYKFLRLTSSFIISSYGAFRGIVDIMMGIRYATWRPTKR